MVTTTNLSGSTGEKAGAVNIINIQEKDRVAANIKNQKDAKDGTSDSRPKILKSATKGMSGGSNPPVQTSGNYNDGGIK